jgi:hypothetical protein
MTSSSVLQSVLFYNELLSLPRLAQSVVRSAMPKGLKSRASKNLKPRERKEWFFVQDIGWCEFRQARHTT